MISRSFILLAALLSPSAVAQQVTQPVIQSAPASPAVLSPASSTTAKGDWPVEVSSSTYVIGPGDTIQLSVWKEPGMSNPSVAVRPDGEISLALLGDIPAAGQTPMALSNDIATRLKKYVNDPLVTVTVLMVHPKEIYIIGEIAHTGAVQLTPTMTPLQAIAAAGGLSSFAKTKLYILRKGAAKESKISFDYKKALKTGDQQGITLIPGDTIVVP